MDAKEIVVGMHDTTLLEIVSAAVAEAQDRGLELPAVLGTVATNGAEAALTPEANTTTLRESLLGGVASAYQTYSVSAEAANTRRAEAKGRRKPEQLAVVDEATVQAEVERVLDTPGVLETLAADIASFTARPESGSPEAGFELVVVPEGLETEDEAAIAGVVQAGITDSYRPYVRPSDYNDTRERVATGTGFRIAFAPRHYNVPSGTTAQQTRWMEDVNQRSTATELQTATDGEALAFVHELQAGGELQDPDTRFNQTYFRRFDQAPVGVVVSYVCVRDFGRLYLGRSHVRYDLPARALVVPKA